MVCVEVTGGEAGVQGWGCGGGVRDLGWGCGGGDDG